MNRFYLVLVSRFVLLLGAVVVILTPAAFVLLTGIDSFLLDYPTVRLINMVGLVTLIGLAITQIVRPLQRLLRRTVFAGSFDYKDALGLLANKVTTAADLKKVIPTTVTALSYLTNAPVELKDGTEYREDKTSDVMHLALRGIQNSYFVFGKK